MFNIIKNFIIPNGFVGWVISKNQRKKLRTMFPPRYSIFVGHHITYKVNCRKQTLPDVDAKVVGHFFYDGIQALIVSVNGTIYRKDGVVFHITWSRSKNKQSRDAGNIIKYVMANCPDIIDDVDFPLTDMTSYYSEIK